jgi:hypothetical protein
MDAHIYSPCGIICDDCAWYKGDKQPQCPGCKTVDGKPFWGACETYSCVEEHDVEHCGLCREFPCEGFIDRFDPGEGPSNAVMRVGLLSYRAMHGDEKAIELTRKILRKEH